MENSRNTLVIIGHHKEELEFGRELKRHMILRGCKGIGFYSVINNFTNNGHGTEEQISTASNEIYREMERSRPDITIDIHIGDNGFDGIELIAGGSPKLDSLNEVIDMEELAHSAGKIFVNKNYSGTREISLLKQDTFPYLVLEQYLLDEKVGPSVKELEFARKTIEKISALYEKH